MKPLDLEQLQKWHKALHTQYQLYLEPRNSEDAPTIDQLSLIREAHLNIISLINQCIKSFGIS